jgi:hypothetical protein
VSLEAEGVTRLASPGQSLRRYLIPALLGTLGGLVPGAGVGVAAVVFKVLAGTVVGASMTAIGDRLIGDGCNSYLSQYRHLRYRFERSPELAQPIDAVARRVEEVFGRPLG